MTEHGSNDVVVDTVTAKVVATASYTGGFLALVSGLTLNDWGVIVGITIAIATFVANVMYRHRQFTLEKRDRAARLLMETREHEERLHAMVSARDEHPHC